ncbi:prepilin-type N-terminal cleavage/methylation domain-containing protein [Actinoplanes sp. NPDC026619]|uniref:prepilin-type N-terminal cleavage/methylation domain-containing protein n=1 Tax=Actinoplanes sp. NPDC026619 TaxID=3155798 RepID=UPI0033E8F442
MRGDVETGDEGFSLIEVIVSMSVMAVVMVMVTGAITEVYSDVTRTDGLSSARDQIGNSFRRLDKELRYATWVSTPGQVGGAWYLEYATPNNCQQLVFKAGVLTRAVWTLPGTTPGTATTIATDLAQTGSIAPFTVYAPGDQPYASASPNVSGVGSGYEPEHNQIRLRFTGAVAKTTLPLDVLFTAQNTNRNTSALNDCSKGRPSA